MGENGFDAWKNAYEKQGELLDKALREKSENAVWAYRLAESLREYLRDLKMRHEVKDVLQWYDDSKLGQKMKGIDLSKAEGKVENKPETKRGFLTESLDEIYNPKCPSCNSPTKYGELCPPCSIDAAEYAVGDR